ncbi:hypothetical protein R1flu_005838 [Riccia fluitans]|uniref:Bacterial surface antigen (D15) domain-containing protein n=1 Tax=Riccia fluitans TaxID=41844 RepID=A0ABD1YX34_9MARC
MGARPDEGGGEEQVGDIGKDEWREEEDGRPLDAEKGAGVEQVDMEKEQRDLDEDGDDIIDDDDEEDEEDPLWDAPKLAKKLSDKLSREPIKIRVHDVQIRGTVKTKESVLEAQLQEVKRAETMQELLQESVKANARLRGLGVFEKCTITIDAGPEELPGTANVTVEVEETKRPFSGDVGVFSKPETKTWTLDGTVKWRNLLGYGETIDATGCYGWDTTSELSAGVNYPRFHGLQSSLISRATILTQDWQKYSSYRERLKGFSLGLINEDNHEVSYNLTWRELEDPTRQASHAIRRQLGHHLLSSLKYTFKVDERDSAMRPTRGYAFTSSSQLAGIGPDEKLLRFARQELELRYAVPLGFLNGALNFGCAGGIIMPWGPNFLSKSTPISDRYFMGGHTSLLGNLKGPSALLGFRTRGVGPNAARLIPQTTGQTDASAEERPRMVDTLGGDLAVSGFVDVSMDLPFRILREWGIHMHGFACAGNLVPLTGEDRASWSWKGFLDTFRVSCGAGLVFPTKLFRLEVNYCYILRKQEQDRAKRGIQVSLTSPH